MASNKVGKFALCMLLIANCALLISAAPSVMPTVEPTSNFTSNQTTDSNSGSGSSGGKSSNGSDDDTNETLAYIALAFGITSLVLSCIACVADSGSKKSSK